MRSFMKKFEFEDEEILKEFNFKNTGKKPVILAVSLLVFVSLSVFAYRSINQLQLASVGEDSVFNLVTSPVAAASAKRDIISIPKGEARQNPFLPYRKLRNEIKTETLINDVPQVDLIIPPDFPGEGVDAAKIMDTVVSGILFDKFSPSAILNIDGNDYLVKKGDVVHDYKILNIAQNNVTVQFGKNTYTAGIGEILTEGSVNRNDIANLDKKFGGEKR